MFNHKYPSSASIILCAFSKVQYVINHKVQFHGELGVYRTELSLIFGRRKCECVSAGVIGTYIPSARVLQLWIRVLQRALSLCYLSARLSAVGEFTQQCTYTASYILYALPLKICSPISLIEIVF